MSCFDNYSFLLYNNITMLTNVDIMNKPKSEKNFYSQLLKQVCKNLSIDKTSPDFDKQNQRNRLLFFFLAKEMKKNKENSLNFISEGIQDWISKGEEQQWIDSWNDILNQLRNDNWKVLYEDSENMKNLRNKKPFPKFQFLDKKLKKEVIKYISKS